MLIALFGIKPKEEKRTFFKGLNTKVGYAHKHFEKKEKGDRHRRQWVYRDASNQKAIE